MKLFLHIDPKTILESHTATSAPKILDEIDALADTIDANMGKEVTIPKDVLDSFKIKDTLNQDIWTNDVLNPKVRAKLIRVAMDFFKDLNLPLSVKIKDIIFTGSLANFNWSKYSDIDLHIVIDFNQFDAEPQFVEDYFYAQKSIWNQEHDITVFNYPVELYVQNVNDNLVATAVYSVGKDKWLKKPHREKFNLDKTAIKAKANAFIHKLRDIRQDYQDHQYQSVVDKVTKLKDKIKAMRNAGLERGGEFSLENLVFKTLRRTPFMDVLDSFKAKAYDTLMSVSEITTNPETEPISETDDVFNQGGVILIKGAKLEDGTQKLYVTTISNRLGLDRTKVDNTEGKKATMAVLGNQIYKLSVVDGKLKAQGVAWNSHWSMLKALGLSGNSVAVNNNKTPLHWETLKFNNIAKAVSDNNEQILRLPNIKW